MPAAEVCAWPGYTRANALRGLLIYGGGDTVAALILGEFSLSRLAAISLLGATLYAVEVPNWFHLIDRLVPGRGGLRVALSRTALALAYFNPLWIARHLAVIQLAGGRSLSWSLFGVAGSAFLANIPLALAANWLIQNRMPRRWRFTASALYSALMAVYYALCQLWFAR
ncbi:MAG: hypothetical protein PHU46_10315 [Rhodocyclaceae bacterium]|nr:hypothetical protein [Rhodocyclaceae bacterium]